MTWYRSLYWRIAVGFIACLAVLLLVQGILFVWVMSAAGSTVPNQPPERLAQIVALDITSALEREPSLDVEQYVRQEYAKDTQPFMVLLVGGRVIDIGGRFPESMRVDARARLEQLQGLDPARLARGGPFGRGAFRAGDNRLRERPGETAERTEPFPGPFGPDGVAPERPLSAPPGSGPAPDSLRMPPNFGRGAPGPRGPRPGLIVAGGKLVGMVLVPGQPPFTFLLARYAPTLITVAGVTLVMGGVLGALVVFGPARRRLKEVENAARRLGSGDLSARAPVAGNDEVTAVASAFNAMADDLSVRTEALVEADRARRQLLADVSHELNTPVTAMRGYLETLSMPELELDEATRARYLTIVGDETARLERLIGDLLDLARLEGGGGALHIEELQVTDLFERVKARHERAARASNVRIEEQVATGAEVVFADRTRIEQAIQNLAANALRYAPAGSAVRLEARPEGGGVSITVTDSGPGIPVEHLPRVFDRFYKVDASRALQMGESAGSGLGLSIVKAIVERLGARISVKSQPGQTVFTIHGLAASEPHDEADVSDGEDTPHVVA